MPSQFLEAPASVAGELPPPPEWQVARPHLTGYDLMQARNPVAPQAYSSLPLRPPTLFTPLTSTPWELPLQR